MTSLTVPPCSRAHPAVVLELGLDGGDPALLREHRAHRRLRRGASARQRADQVEHAGARRAGRAQHDLGVVAQGGDRVAGVLDRVADGLGDQRRRARDGLRPPVVVHRLARLGVDVEDHLAEVDGGDAVDQHLVGLGEDREPALLQPLDQVDLPERAVPVELARHDPGGQLAELVHRPRARQRRAAYVVGQVEVVVVHPHRAGQPAGDGADPLAVARHERDAVGDQPDQAVVVEPVGRRLEDLEGRVVHGRARRLGDQEGHVVGAEALAHRYPFPCAGWSLCDSGTVLRVTGDGY